MRILSIFLITLIPATFTYAQFTKAIEDNSFVIEEAYNQEEGVVQHIFACSKNPYDDFFEIDFTQELPLSGQTHQLSYTLPFFVPSNPDDNAGMGDMLLSYRYQLINENGLAIAPRFSLVLPSGDNGYGNDVFGIQLNFPLSRRWNNEFVTHFNAGLTFLPNVKPTVSVLSTDVIATKKNIITYSAGASGIFLASPRFNVMAEALYSSKNGSDEIILSPGIRYAINIGSLQIVPGLAFPFYFVASRNTETGFFLYLSFEQ